jgi:hypothetical protein
VRKEEDGSVAGVAIADLDHDGKLDLVQFEGASSGLLSEHDYEQAREVLEPGASAAILIYENTWAAPFVSAVRKSGAELVSSGRIPADALLEALDAREAAEV